jgi:hypothetical protein
MRHHEVQGHPHGWSGLFGMQTAMPWATKRGLSTLLMTGVFISSGSPVVMHILRTSALG